MHRQPAFSGHRCSCNRPLLLHSQSAPLRSPPQCIQGQLPSGKYPAQAITAAKRQRPTRTVLPLLPRLRRPQRFAFVTNPKDLDPDEVDALWTLAFGGQPQEPRRWRTRERWAAVLRHSFAVQAVYEVVPGPRGSDEPQSSRRLIGFARAISDGIFAALVCDVMIHPEYQRQGLGKKMMGALLRHVRKRGPSSFGAFPRPQQRMFFWETGFRVTRKFRVMRYQLPPGDDIGPTSQLVPSQPPAVRRVQIVKQQVI